VDSVNKGGRDERELTSTSSSQFPSDRGIPDIGPKMYNAFVSGLLESSLLIAGSFEIAFVLQAAKEGPGGHGS
jgi:hypothetical protein